MNLFLLICFFFISFCFVVLLYFYLQNRRELKDAYSQYDAKVETIEKCKEKIRDLNKQIRGERIPSSNCIGCKYLIISDSNPCNFMSNKRYNCRKNLRCREYEEEAREKPCL